MSRSAEAAPPAWRTRRGLMLAVLVGALALGALSGGSGAGGRAAPTAVARLATLLQTVAGDG